MILRRSWVTWRIRQHGRQFSRSFFRRFVPDFRHDRWIVGHSVNPRFASFAQQVRVGQGNELPIRLPPESHGLGFIFDKAREQKSQIIVSPLRDAGRGKEFLHLLHPDHIVSLGIQELK